MNPPIVPHPDQSGMRDGAIRFIMSLRAVGGLRHLHHRGPAREYGLILSRLIRFDVPRYVAGLGRRLGHISEQVAPEGIAPLKGQRIEVDHRVDVPAGRLLARDLRRVLPIARGKEAVVVLLANERAGVASQFHGEEGLSGLPRPFAERLQFERDPAIEVGRLHPGPETLFAQGD